jgi:hypothetical protein
MRRALALVTVLALAACGDDDDDGVTDDNTPTIDAGPDAAGPDPTFAAYVIDQVLQNTDSTSDPRPFSEFADLPDPAAELDDTAAFDVLFLP